MLENIYIGTIKDAREFISASLCEPITYDEMQRYSYLLFAVVKTFVPKDNDDAAPAIGCLLNLAEVLQPINTPLMQCPPPILPASGVLLSPTTLAPTSSPSDAEGGDTPSIVASCDHPR